MKKWFLKSSINLIKKYNTDLDNDKLDEIRYGLEALYLTVTKLIVIISISIYLGIIEDSLLILLLFNVLRLTGFGLHASKSWVCLITSGITFIGIPFLCRSIIIPEFIVYFLVSICIICILKYAPADTSKRPLVDEVKRLRYKILTLCTAVIYLFAIVYVTDSFIINAILFSMIVETVLILPISYKIFHMSYRNYEKYELEDF